MKKTIIISIIIYVFLTVISSGLIIKFYFNNESYKSQNIDISFKINDPNYSIKLDEEYQEKGAVLKINNKAIEDLKIDSSNIDNTKYGKYYVSYKYKINDLRTVNLYRKIEIIDDIPPIINLKGSEIEQLEIGSDYVDPGYEVIDDSKEDLTSSVKVTGEVDTTTEGTYKIKYEVSDSSGNKTEVIRTVMVYKKITMISQSVETKEEDDSDFKYSNYTNTVAKMNFTENGFYIEGYYKNYTGDYRLKISGNNVDKYYNLTKNNDKYIGNIDITNLENGTYNIYIITNKEEPLKSELEIINKIVRAHVGNKLVTMIYTNNNVGFKVEDFAYQYDILIDPGHGGFDPGAVNNVTKESTINLEQSLYEKMRYEQHGLKVLMIRNDDSDGIVMGPDDMKFIRRRAYAIGYYGAVAKIVYSNHHNNSTSSYMSGWEILLPANLSKNQLKSEYEIANDFSKIYSVSEDHKRLYARDYESEIICDKSNGEIYNFRNYYAVIRIPYELYNVKNVIYEGCYMSNYKDFSWYYINKNYINLSEIKIKHYVESLGITYIPRGEA